MAIFNSYVSLPEVTIINHWYPIWIALTIINHNWVSPMLRTLPTEGSSWISPWSSHGHGTTMTFPLLVPPSPENCTYDRELEKGRSDNGHWGQAEPIGFYLWWCQELAMLLHDHQFMILVISVILILSHCWSLYSTVGLDSYLIAVLVYGCFRCCRYI